MGTAHGIKETKEIIKFVVEFAEAIEKSLEDGEFTFLDVTNMISALQAVGDAFGNIKQVPTELKDLDEMESLELYAYAKDELDLKSDKTEEIIESSLEIGLKLFELYNLIRKPDPKEEPTEEPKA